MRNGMRIASVICVALLACFATDAAWASPDAALTGGLKELVASWERGDPRLASHLALHVTDSKGSPLVMLRLAPGTRLEQVLPQLKAQGFRLTTHSTINPSLVEGYLPLSAARSVAAISGIQAVRATQVPAKHAGAVQSQAVALQKADIAQANGFDGSGIRVGALSDSFDGCGVNCSTTAADDVASGDLPAGGVTVLQDLLDGTGTDEGRAMLQLVHDIAPGAQLGFATAFGGMLGFAENILALRSQFHADVIVDDVYYSDEPMYSDGIIAQAVNLVSHAGAAYYSSAGNNGVEAWEGVYSPLSFARAQDLVADGRANVHLEQIPAAIRP